jgi:SAM-dependent methyltransferase
MRGEIKKSVLESYSELLFGESFNDNHLGGCNIYGDPGSECPKMWKYLIDKYQIKSVLDVGCGFGYHLKYFKEILNLDINGIEGSSKVTQLSFFPNEILPHDYSTGLSTFSKKIDFVWSVEFVEHVDELYVDNFMKDISMGNYVVITHAIPGQPGHHHVNCQNLDYWISVFDKYGFEYDSDETKNIRNLAIDDFKDYANWLKIDISKRSFRTFASDEYDSNANRLGNSQAHVAENAIFFRKIKK